MNVLVFKLTSGEEVIGTEVSETTDTYTLGKARVLIMQQGHDGSIGLGMIPFMPSANDPEAETERDVEINKEFIMARPVSVPKSLEDAYLRSTSVVKLV